MQKYMVQPGDTLNTIAKAYYGHANRAKDIARANGIRNPRHIKAGWKLVLPDISPALSTSEASPSSSLRDASDEGFRVTESQLADIMKTTADVMHYCEAVNACLQRYTINTPLRAAHFLAQVAHESGGLRSVEENLAYGENDLKAVYSQYFKDDSLTSGYAGRPQKIANRVYANRLGNGGEHSGDGWRYRGRGLIPLTGKANYIDYADARHVDVVKDPDQVAVSPMLATDVAGWYWDSRALNRFADNDDIRAITKRIHGGCEGLKEREFYLQRAKDALQA